MKIQAVRIDRTVQGDREIQLPFRCFACHDGGLAGGRYIAHFVEGDSDIPFICNREDCEAGRTRRAAYGANSDRLYQNSFDARLDKYACQDIHEWEKQSFINDMVAKKSKQVAPVAIAEQFTQAVSDRQLLFEEIQQAINSLGKDISLNIAKFLKHCCDRDSIQYLNIEALPTSDYSILLSKIKGLTP